MTILFSESLAENGIADLQLSAQQRVIGKPFARLSAKGTNGSFVVKDIQVPPDGRWYNVTVPVLRSEDGTVYLGETKTELLRKEIISMSNRETSDPIASLAARILKEEPREGDQHLSYNALLVQAKRLAGSCLSQAEDDDNQPITVAITATVDWDKITNAIIGSFEGGSTSWLHEATYYYQPDGVEGNPLYAEDQFWAKGGKMLLNYDDPEEEEEGSGTGYKEVGLIEIRKGLRSMAEKSYRHFDDLISEKDDADTHDVFMQHVIFGEVIYG